MKSLILWAGLLLVTTFVPLLGGPRYEAALVAGVIGPFWCAVVSEARCASFLAARAVTPGEAVLKRALAVSLSHVAVVFGVATVGGLWAGYCEPAVGYALLALGPGMGMLLAGLLGGMSSLMVLRVPSFRLRRLVGVTLAVAAPLGAICWGLFRFYDSPSVYAYSPFVGYFAGPLYDNVSYDLERLSGYRGGTLLSWVAISGLLSSICVQRREGDRLRLAFGERTPERLALILSAALAALGSLMHSSLSEEMGYSRSTASIRAELGRSLQKGPCRVFFSRGVDELEASQIADECRGHLSQLSRYFALESVEDVDVYLFSNHSEKKRFMGAGTTYIAKPWRREIYIQPAGFPHPVLGHELAHVVTEEFGQGPFRIAGSLGGWVPDPGRIEGFAEAASPKEHSEGTLHQWTAAMKELKLLPPLSSLFRLSFLGSSAARAYAASGSFVDFVRERHGPDVLKQWYAGGDLSALSSTSLGDLEGEWHDFLGAVDIPERVLEIARPRFSRPGVFERKCPHAVDRLVSEAVALCPYQEEKARRLAGEAIELDGTKRDLELHMARCGFYQGDGERSREDLLEGAQKEALYDPGARRAAWEFAGNIAWATGKVEHAREAFQAAQALTYDIDTARNLEVKLWALGQPAPVERPLRYLLAPRPRERNLPQLYLTEWMGQGPHQELARYLLARTLFAGHVQQADALVEELGVDKLPLSSLQLEAARMKLLSSCRRALRGGNVKELDAALKFVLEQEPHEARVLEAKRVAERCRVALPEGAE